MTKPDRPDVELRDVFAVVVTPLGVILALVFAVLLIPGAPVYTGLLLAGVALAFAGYHLGTRRGG